MKEVIFACAENKKRSQMAEAIFNSLASKAHAASAGTFPANTIDPLTIQVLKEIGIEKQALRPKLLKASDLDKADIIVSFGCLIASMFPKDKFLEWQVEDPHTIDEFRASRDKITNLVKELVASIEPPAA